MFKLYCSGSTQEKNHTVDGKTEEFYMQRLAREISLELSGECLVRLNHQEWSLRQVVNDSNMWRPDFHLALHTNAMPKPGTASGTEVWIHNDSVGGNRMADILIAKVSAVLNLPVRGGKQDPNTKETGIDGGHLAELDDTNAPACLIEICFHDNQKDLERFKEKWEYVKMAVADSVREYILTQPKGGWR